MLPPSDAQQQVIARLTAQKAQAPAPDLMLKQVDGGWAPADKPDPNATALADAGTQADWQAFTQQHAAHLPPVASNLEQLLQEKPLQGYLGEQPLLPTATYGPGSSDPSPSQPGQGSDSMLNELFNAYMQSRSVQDSNGNQIPWTQQNQQQFSFAPSPVPAPNLQNYFLGTSV